MKRGRCVGSLNFRALQEPRVVGKGCASVTGIGKVGHGRSNSVQESNVNDVDVGVLVITVSSVLSPFSTALPFRSW